MNRSELQQFAQQLALWTELVIENGRTPFRRVDLYPQIRTQAGPLRPPLVFWINRQSMMAGGILLLPEGELLPALAEGRHCAEALGLQHFVTWETDRVRIWEIAGDTSKQHLEFLFSGDAHPDSFRQLLGKLLEALKLLAVVGLVASDKLSPHYLHNLFETTLELALPPLQNSFRSLRAQTAEGQNDDADRLAVETNRQLLLILLSLLWYRQLPSAILPEKLERAIEISLPQLPEPLQQALTWNVLGAQTSLPHDSLVCFHHLLLRLRQLAWDQSTQRALSALRLLIAGWFCTPDESADPAEICIYPRTPQPQERCNVLLSDSPSLLAAAGLLDHLCEQPLRRQYYGNLLQFTPDELPAGSVTAALTSLRLPGRDERQQYAALLRTSWPNRRFRLPASTPLWMWETVHLLGLYKHPAPLRLTLPPELLSQADETPLWSLLAENYLLLAVSRTEENRLALKLQRAAGDVQSIVVSTGAEERRLAPNIVPGRLRDSLLLALQLPSPLWQLYSEQLVVSGDEPLTELATAGLRVYGNSLLGRYLWQLLGRPVPDSNQLAESAAASGWPHPEAGLLEELGRAVQTGQIPASRPDELLARLLDCPAILGLELPSVPTKAAGASKSQHSDKKLQQELAQQLHSEGLPTFPEKYLYFLEQPQMVTYRFTPPLNLRNDLLGQYELVDAAGADFQIYGEELLRTLLLCSELGKSTVDLPADRMQLTLLLDQYIQDLRNLYQRLNELCFQRIDDSKAARKLARKTWAKLELPPLKWLQAQP